MKPETPGIADVAPRPLLGSGLRRQRPGGGAFFGAVVLHLGVLATFWSAGALHRRNDPDDFTVYRVSIVSPPPQEKGEYQPNPPAATPAAPTPPEEKPEPKPEPPKVTAPAPTPAPAKKDAAKPKPSTTTSGSSRGTGTEPTRGNNPQAGSPGGEGLNVQMDGVECPSPGYCENIIRQINRHFRWSGAGRPRAVVGFIIRSDGTVSDIELTRPSGNVAFDFAVKGAVEAAGRRNAFGRLPKEFGRDFLPVQFGFSPP